MFERSANLNNRAAGMLRSGNLELSIDLLRKAIRSMMEDQFDTTSSSCVRASTATLSTEQSKHLQILQYSMSNVSTSHFLFSQGITTLVCFDQSDNQVNASIISSIMCFNLGLVYHLRGRGSHASKNLPKANSLYHKSLSILSEVDTDFLSGGKAIVDLLTMALVNNLAHISIELCHYKQSKNYFAELKRICTCLNPENYRDPFISKVLCSTKAAFLMNAFILEEPMPAAAA